MPTVHETEELKPSKHVRRSIGEDAVPSPGHLRNDVPADYRTINGWGVDLDHKNRPSYPKELPSDVQNVRGKVGARQVPHSTVHVSNEHPDLTPVFGVSCPPKGLSGLLRNYAYEFGEGTNRHWLTLMLADRIDVIESMVTDAVQGKPDRYLKEKAWGTKFAHAEDRPRRTTGAVVLAGAALGVLGVLLAAKMRD